MWAKDVGRETGSGKPLLKTIFQVGERERAWCGRVVRWGGVRASSPLPPSQPCARSQALADPLTPPTHATHAPPPPPPGAGQPQALPARPGPPPHAASVRLPRSHAHPAGAADRDLGGGPGAHVGRDRQAPPGARDVCGGGAESGKVCPATRVASTPLTCPHTHPTRPPAHSHPHPPPPTLPPSLHIAVRPVQLQGLFRGGVRVAAQLRGQARGLCGRGHAAAAPVHRGG